MLPNDSSMQNYLWGVLFAFFTEDFAPLSGENVAPPATGKSLKTGGGSLEPDANTPKGRNSGLKAGSLEDQEQQTSESDQNLVKKSVRTDGSLEEPLQEAQDKSKAQQPKGHVNGQNNANFLKWAIPASFSFILVFFTTNKYEKMSKQYMVQRFEPTTSEHESSPITTRPGQYDDHFSCRMKDIFETRD